MPSQTKIYLVMGTASNARDTAVTWPVAWCELETEAMILAKQAKKQAFELALMYDFRWDKIPPGANPFDKDMRLEAFETPNYYVVEVERWVPNNEKKE